VWTMYSDSWRRARFLGNATGEDTTWLEHFDWNNFNDDQIETGRNLSFTTHLSIIFGPIRNRQQISSPSRFRDKINKCIVIVAIANTRVQ
jgi:hypothetical protein